MTVRAPGKIVLSGAYVVLEGAPALVAAVDRFVLADAARPAEIVTAEVQAAIDAGALPRACAFDASGLRSEDGARKLGLGSSAAILVATMAAVLGAPETDDERRALLGLARDAHRRAQGGGSGLDVAASVLGGVLRCRLAGDALEASTHALPRGVRVVVLASGVASSTPDMLARVAALRGRDPARHAALFARAARGAEDAVEARTPAALVAALGAQRDALGELGELAGAPIVTPEVAELASLADDLGWFAGPAGAGGGDVAILVGPGEPPPSLLEAAAARGLDPIDARVGAPGVGEAASAGSPSREALPPLRDLSVPARRRRVARERGLRLAELERALASGGLTDDEADAMVENALGRLALPFGVALHVRVDGHDHLVPMVIEEPSVIAAASSAAKRVRAGGGFRTEVDPSLMVAQIEVHDVADVDAARARVAGARDALLAAAGKALPGLVSRGGGPRDLEVRDLGGGMLVAEICVDCRDAMGANMLNTLAEALGPEIARLAGGELGLRILSNDAARRCTRVTCELPFSALAEDPSTAADHARRIRLASEMAERDPRRAITHNKGIMNGVDAVVVATGNDWRAVEAAAHAFAARSGTYRPLSTWRDDPPARTLRGRMEIPLALGTVGGALRAHRGARLALELLGVTSAQRLCAVAASVGLASNLAALRALATEGIQRGHMALHQRAIRGAS